jgi:tRNA dimethylallyltransferase
MITHGLVDEVTGLRKFRDLNALQTVGYNELFDYLDDKTSLDEAINSIKINTRRYAKRQLTWFKKDTDITWVDANNTKVEFAKQLL